MVEVNALQLLEDRLTRCPECKNQISMDDIDPEVFEEMDSGRSGEYKSASSLLSSDFDL